jgi:SAM-dependent methyltransferase
LPSPFNSDLGALRHPDAVTSEPYRRSIDEEKRAYENSADIHRLPSIFHYWSNRHILPKFQALGFNGALDVFARELRKAGNHPAFASLGAGNCETEIQLALSMDPDVDFRMDCIDLNPATLKRGQAAAELAGVAHRLRFIPADLNRWEAKTPYDCVIAHQFLHHVVNLEGLFQQVKKSLRPGGRFLISDMIGRNGHLRWPEALEIVHEFWRKLPPSHRYNCLLGSYEELYQNWDCSTQGFEGVRAQDILPLLVEQFHFHLFLPYGNVIDPFVDRAFGGHFDPANEWDRGFIDAVQERDEKELESGHLKPTHMLAVVANEPCACPKNYGGFSPASSVRRTDSILAQPRRAAPFYQWEAWPHPTQQQLEIACGRLAELDRENKQRTAWALSLNEQLQTRTAWALSLQQDLKDYAALVPGLEKELMNRTAWAQRLESELEERTRWALNMQQEIECMRRDSDQAAAQVESLQADLAQQLQEKRRLDAEVRRLLHQPLYLLRRLLRGLRNRLSRVKTGIRPVGRGL